MVMLLFFCWRRWGFFCVLASAGIRPFFRGAISLPLCAILWGYPAYRVAFPWWRERVQPRKCLLI